MLDVLNKLSPCTLAPLTSEINVPNLLDCTLSFNMAALIFKDQNLKARLKENC